MISAPIYTRGLNGMIVKNYTQKQLGKMTKPEPVTWPTITSSMSFDIVPERRDMAEIRQYFADQEATAGWTRASVTAPKTKTTDDLMREFIIKSLDQENHRRAMKEAESDMPFSGVLASAEEQQRLATKALGEAKVKTEGAKGKIVRWLGSPQMVTRAKTLASMSPTFATPSRSTYKQSATPFMTPSTAMYSDADDTDEEQIASASAMAGSARRPGRPPGSKNKTGEEIIQQAIEKATGMSERKGRK